MYGEYIAERVTGYPWQFYYNWASDILAGELEDFRRGPRGFLGSMGWDPDQWLPKVRMVDVGFTQEDAMELAGILKKHFDRYAEKMADPGEATIATMEENEVEDFITNTIAGCIRSAASA